MSRTARALWHPRSCSARSSSSAQLCTNDTVYGGISRTLLTYFDQGSSVSVFTPLLSILLKCKLTTMYSYLWRDIQKEVCLSCTCTTRGSSILGPPKVSLQCRKDGFRKLFPSWSSSLSRCTAGKLMLKSHKF